VGNLRWADVVVQDPELSGVHFRVETRLGQCWVRDLDSRSGTRVNGVRVIYAELQDGDEICAGSSRFIVTMDTEPRREPMPAQRSVAPADSMGSRISLKLSTWHAAG
jgi:pSer/pThr/pTyr-binding forkhead associated (FHA) protein